MYDVVVKKITFAISSPDECLVQTVAEKPNLFIGIEPTACAHSTDAIRYMGWRTKIIKL